MEVFEDARAVDAAGPACDACLGRVFADRSFGLTNAERGRALRVSLGLADDEEPAAVTPADCWVCEGYCAAFDDWADRAADAVGDVGFDTYQVGTKAPPLVAENERLLREDAGLAPDTGERFKKEFNREVGKRLGRALGAEVDFERPHVQFTLDLPNDRVETAVNSAFVYGRYRKLERDIPQTEWPCRECHGSGYRGSEPCDRCDGAGYLYEESVEQLTAPVVEDVMDGTQSTFHGAGREDVDALMLGTGRPFVVEVEEPRRREADTERLQADINAFAEGKVDVEGLALARYDMVERVKRHDASKRYRAAVAFDEPVTDEALAVAADELDGATVAQDTPERVDHRRASRTRVREAYSVTAERDGDRHATVEVHGEGGLYVKELVSGDEGRTEPSLAGLLGVGAAVDELDVLAVEGEDEPFETEPFFWD